MYIKTKGTVQFLIGLSSTVCVPVFIGTKILSANDRRHRHIAISEVWRRPSINTWRDTAW